MADLRPFGAALAPPTLVERMAAIIETLQAILNAAEQGSLRALLDQPGDAPIDDDPQTIARAVHSRLHDVMEQQWQGMQQSTPATQHPVLRDALYVFAAVVDEQLLLEASWPGRVHWLGLLLERRMFGTRIAGRRVFDLAQRAVADANSGPMQRELVAVLLLALQIGFKGMHRGATGTAAIQKLRARLHQALGEVAPETEALFPQAYSHTLRESGDERFAPLAAWRQRIAWVVCGWLLLSTLLWWWLIAAPQAVGVAGR